MPRRLFIASIVSVAMAATSLTVVGHAQTVAAPSTSVTSAVSQATSTHAAALPAPKFVCAPNVLGDLLCTVLGLTICNPKIGHQCDIFQSATAAPARSTAMQPLFECSPGFQILCTVLGATICNPNAKIIGHQCDINVATTEATATQARGLGSRRVS